MTIVRENEFRETIREAALTLLAQNRELLQLRGDWKNGGRDVLRALAANVEELSAASEVPLTVRDVDDVLADTARVGLTFALTPLADAPPLGERLDRADQVVGRCVYRQLDIRGRVFVAHNLNTAVEIAARLAQREADRLFAEQRTAAEAKVTQLIEVLCDRFAGDSPAMVAARKHIGEHRDLASLLAAAAASGTELDIRFK